MNQSLPLFQLDAFAPHPFSGNPAAVCPLPSWPSTEKLLAFAREMNLPATAFIVALGESYQIRWFTPVREIELCGHASLATAWVLYNKLGYSGDFIRFQSQSGALIARQLLDSWIQLDFPQADMKPIASTEALWEGLGAHPIECLGGLDLMAVFDDESIISEIQPELPLLATLPYRGIIVTAPGKNCDFVSRFFAPRYGIDEDSVTGSAHCALTPYWAARMKKSQFLARQLSKRGGELRCTLNDDRVMLAGQVAEVFQASFHASLLGL